MSQISPWFALGRKSSKGGATPCRRTRLPSRAMRPPWPTPSGRPRLAGILNRDFSVRIGADDFAAGRAAQRAVGRQADALLEEPHRPVAEREVRTAGVQAHEPL